MVVPGYTKAAGKWVQESGQQQGMWSGKNPDRSVCPALEQEGEDHRNGQALDLSVYRSEAVHHIPAEVEAHHSEEEGCTQGQDHRHMVADDQNSGNWQCLAIGCKGSIVAGHSEAHCSQMAGLSHSFGTLVLRNHPHC